MTTPDESKAIQVNALIAIAITERLAHELDEHTERLRLLIAAEREAKEDE